MPAARFEPSSIKNKIKRQDVFRKGKKARTQAKLQKRLAQAKLEANDPAQKKKRLTEHIPKTLDNTREFDPSIINHDSNEDSTQDEIAADIATDPFASYFTTDDPTTPPKILITTSPKASKATYNFCDELVGVFPGAEFIRRKKGKGFEIGWIAAWTANRGYKHLCVVNEDHKKPNAITLVYLPHGPTAYFKLTSVELTKQIYGHARATAHNPELILNGFTTRLGHGIGRMFQTTFPPVPEFQGRQVVTLHNQRDFLFFRRHRYAFRSTEKVALQEIGPRFTLKLRWLKKNVPAVQNFGEDPKPLTFDTDDDPFEQSDEVQPEQQNVQTADMEEEEGEGESSAALPQSLNIVPPKQDEYIWQWKPELETTRRTFFL
ncbi:hypothetical protein AGABI1DRAFT_118863 [Agaricus bisporus var. burnettii JB137-S8]|uniref:Brix domain-containing protein n=1 Tax=Agaricus bisporus var. burnettii (strain JB137-S8 / ATCC MYA-4627 / FGSC 10392) TaxID=597362 RepID=K5W4R1_AGABU|nr:uncharacterized protein AGABI1DRAFT_118863 [Agaricus bisporus var. burnettii JB137-S8]EKM81789.1 hypothetical protein AGABI1DRAFT_118863 [Agaricus bisporus var. burnettii JB137-S8]